VDRLDGVLGAEIGLHRRLLLRGEPLGVSGLAGQQRQHEDADQHSGNSFEQEHPLPAVKVADLVQRLQRPTRQRATDDAAHRDRGEEERGRAGPAGVGVPVRQVEDDAREEPGLGHTEQEPEQVELPRALCDHHQRRQDAPADHDPGDPHPGTEALQEQVAGNFEEEVADEEDACTKAVDGGRESEVLAHLELSESDVDAIDVVEDVGQEQQRKDTQADLAVGTVAYS
jgi:hypothetical protein